MPANAVSIVLPVYNSASTIRRCIDSILAQSFKDFYILIVDDCSNDKTPEILRSYEDHINISISYNSTNLGAYASRNKAIRNSQSKYIAFIDADDEWSSDKLDIQMKQIANGAKFCYSNALIIKPSCSYLAFSVLKPNRSKYSRDVNNLLDTPTNFIVQSSVLVEKDLLIKNNLFTEERLTADYIMWLKIFLSIENKYIVKSDKPLVAIMFTEKTLAEIR